jgi:hypothetical protein
VDARGRRNLEERFQETGGQLVVGEQFHHPVGLPAGDDDPPAHPGPFSELSCERFHLAGERLHAAELDVDRRSLVRPVER